MPTAPPIEEHIANAPSIRLAGKAGYARVGEARYRDAPTLLFERRRAGLSPSVAR